MQFDPAMLHVYLVGGTQDTANDPHLFLDKIEQAMQAGITAFQYREKGNSTLLADQKVQMAQRIRSLTRQYHIPYFIDDDEQLALQVGADGVHVGQKDQRIATVIKNARGKLMIGYSCNTPAEIAQANQFADVDYIGAGPIYPTQSKADADPALGVAQLRKLVQQSVHPVVAIGGLSLLNMQKTMSSGAAGMAVISMILGARDLSSTVRLMRQLYDQ